MIDFVKETLSYMSLIDMGLIILVPILIVQLSRGLVALFVTRKKLKEEMKQLQENKCKGPHSWFKITLFDNELNVCQDCCYVPTYDTFIKREVVNAHLKQIELKNKWEDYKEEKYKEIAKEHNLDGFDEIKEIIHKVSVLKQDFYVEHLENVLKEMEEEKNDKKEAAE